MKKFARLLFFLAPLVASAVSGAVPPINVIVSDASGKVAFKSITNANGTFTTGNLKPGPYVVQFTSTSAALRGNYYGLVVSAGKAKVAANAVAGEKFAAAGVAMKITAGEPIADILKKNPRLNNPAAIRAMEQMEREAPVNITGQVTAEGKK